MIKFNTLIGRKQRITQKDITPASVKGRGVTQDFIKNDAITAGSFTLADGVTATITSVTAIKANPNVKLGALPYAISLFETSATTANLIPFGSGIATGRYTVTGPTAVPTGLDPIGSDGSNLVFKTSIANNSGSSQTILYYIQVRFISSAGGGVFDVE